MPEYIEREALIKYACNQTCGRSLDKPVVHCHNCYMVDVLEEAPAADVVAVVRCKECKRGEVDDPEYDPDLYYCELGCGWNKGYFFCAYGKRRGEDE